MDKPYRLSELYHQKKDVLSFEVFPPKTDAGITKLLDHLDILKKFRPDFISVTYGAGGSTREVSLDIVRQINSRLPCEVMAHFTCVGTDDAGILSFVKHLEVLGIQNILALRGDPPHDDPDFDFSRGSFKFATELVVFLKKNTRFCIGVAGFPEGHTEAPSKEKDWDYLKEKVDAGGEFIITQLFFDNDDYFRFCEGMDSRGIRVPLVPGILPVASLDRLNRIVNLSGSSLSTEFQSIADKYSQDPQGFLDASIAFSIRQVSELKSFGAPGIHYYILNQSEIISKVLSGL